MYGRIQRKMQSWEVVRIWGLYILLMEVGRGREAPGRENAFLEESGAERALMQTPRTLERGVVT